MRPTRTSALAAIAGGVLLASLGLAQPATAATVDTTLQPGSQLARFDSLTSPHKQHELVVGPEIDDDGLLLSGCGEDILAEVPASSTDTRLVMQTDGNLVLYAGNAPYFQTGTYGNPGARAVLQDDRNLVVYSPANKPLWSAGTVCNRIWNSDARIGDPMATEFKAGHYMQSANGRYKLIMQADGNLVLYRGNRALWSSRTSGRGNTATYEVTGELRVKNSAGKVLWRSRAAVPATTNAVLALQDDGNLVAYRVSNDASRYTPIWSTGTAQR